MRRGFRYAFYSLMALLFAAAGATVIAQDRRNASREPVGLAPDPALVKEAVVQVYGARAVGAKGFSACTPGSRSSPTNAKSWTVYEVIGWRLRWAESVVVVRTREPDGRWFGSSPSSTPRSAGTGSTSSSSASTRPRASTRTRASTRVWPGPNSNTFTAWIARAVPELEVDLPATAIGKDYLGGSVFASAPSGSGYQFSLGGLLGVAASGVEGLELDILGLNIGLGPSGLKLPLIGRIGPALAPVKAEPAAHPAPSAHAAPASSADP